MGWPVDLPEDDPSQYFCEQCHPQDHPALLAAMKKGEPIWLERQKVFKAKRKGGKKGQKGGRQSRVSDIKPEVSDGAASSSPAPTTSQETGTKRKYKEETPQVRELCSRLALWYELTAPRHLLTLKRRPKSPDELPLHELTRGGSRVQKTLLIPKLRWSSSRSFPSIARMVPAPFLGQSCNQSKTRARQALSEFRMERRPSLWADVTLRGLSTSCL